jgi:hypothetical protein
MKTIFMIYCILFRQISIIAVNESLKCGDPIIWYCHDGYQDGSGGSNNAKWASGNTKQEAVWNLYKSPT